MSHSQRYPRFGRCSVSALKDRRIRLMVTRSPTNPICGLCFLFQGADAYPSLQPSESRILFLCCIMLGCLLNPSLRIPTFASRHPAIRTITALVSQAPTDEQMGSSAL